MKTENMINVDILIVGAGPGLKKQQTILERMQLFVVRW